MILITIISIKIFIINKIFIIDANILVYTTDQYIYIDILVNTTDQRTADILVYTKNSN